MRTGTGDRQICLLARDPRKRAHTRRTEGQQSPVGCRLRLAVELRQPLSLQMIVSRSARVTSPLHRNRGGTGPWWVLPVTEGGCARSTAHRLRQSESPDRPAYLCGRVTTVHAVHLIMVTSIWGARSGRRSRRQIQVARVLAVLRSTTPILNGTGACGQAAGFDPRRGVAGDLDLYINPHSNPRESCSYHQTPNACRRETAKGGRICGKASVCHLEKGNEASACVPAHLSGHCRRLWAPCWAIEAGPKPRPPRLSDHHPPVPPPPPPPPD
jgi:hypothetical protein